MPWVNLRIWLTYERVDPEGCGCTDCIATGYSKPFDYTDKIMAQALRSGAVHDATGQERMEGE